MNPHPNETPPKPARSSLLAVLAKNHSGPLAGVALSAVSAWMIVTGLKGLAGFELTQQSALADLLGIGIIIGVVRWVSFRRKIK